MDYKSVMKFNKEQKNAEEAQVYLRENKTQQITHWTGIITFRSSRSIVFMFRMNKKLPKLF